jgi:hypothetical protein
VITRRLFISQLRVYLGDTRRRVAQQHLENTIRPRGHLVCNIDASPLFEPYVQDNGKSWLGPFWKRAGEVRLSSLTLRHAIQVGAFRTPRLVCVHDYRLDGC